MSRLSAAASVCSLIRVCRKLSLIVSDDVVRVITAARVGVSVRCNASLGGRGEGEGRQRALLSLPVWEVFLKVSASQLYLPKLHFFFICAVLFVSMMLPER